MRDIDKLNPHLFISDATIVEDLKEDGEDVGVRLLDFVQENDSLRVFLELRRQSSAVIITLGENNNVRACGPDN